MARGNKLAEESNGLLELEAVTDALVESQYRNYVERGIQVIKKLVRVMSRTFTFDYRVFRKSGGCLLKTSMKSNHNY